MSDLDLTAFLREGNVANLDWLNVSEKEYRELEKLPKQNLDVIPELQKLWGKSEEEAEDGSFRVPYKDLHPAIQDFVIQEVDQNQITKTARLLIMQTTDPRKIKSELLKRFDKGAIRQARTALASVMAERGLLGRFYIDSSDFPACYQGKTRDTSFVEKYAKEAKYVLAKDKCNGCVHASLGPTGKTHCGVFHKEIRVQIPYTEEMARRVEESQRAKGKQVTASSAAPKDRIRLAMLAPEADYGGPEGPKVKDPIGQVRGLDYTARVKDEPVQVKDVKRIASAKKAAKQAIYTAMYEGRLTVQDAQNGFRMVASEEDIASLQGLEKKAQQAQPLQKRVYTGVGEQPAPVFVPKEEVEKTLIAASNLVKKRDIEAAQTVAERKARPIVALIRQELLKGKGFDDVREKMRKAFQITDLEATKQYWAPILKEAGLYGTIYTTQESFGNCTEGANFLAKHNPSIRVVQAGSKCGGCVHNKLGLCRVYNKPLVKNASELYTPKTVEAILTEHKMAGRLPTWDTKTASSWGATPREALQAIYRAAWSGKAQPKMASGRMDVFQAFTGGPKEHVTSQVTMREIVKTARLRLNEGFFGKKLMADLRKKFDVRDIQASAQALKPHLAEQGLQGHYFIDPTVYDDYGKGCVQAEKMHRESSVKYIKKGSACDGCIHQRKAGVCSKVNKRLVDEPPYTNKKAQQQAILSPPKQVVTEDKGRDMLKEFGLHGASLEVEVDVPAPSSDPLAITFDNTVVDIDL